MFERNQREKSKMKKLLLVTTFLVTTSASALAECPYQGPLKSLMSQYRSISNNMNPFDLCSANYLAQNNQLIDLGQQIDAMSLKARRDSRCVLLEKGSVSSLEPIREVWIHDEAFAAASRLSMMRIMAKRTNAATVMA
jgi:hypothetical protein